MVLSPRAWLLLVVLALHCLGVVADARHDALDASKHPPSHFYVDGKRCGVLQSLQGGMCHEWRASPRADRLEP